MCDGPDGINEQIRKLQGELDGGRLAGKNLRLFSSKSMI